MGESFRCIGGQVVYIVKPMFFKEFGHQIMVNYTTLHEQGAFGNMVFKSPLRSSSTTTSWPQR